MVLRPALPEPIQPFSSTATLVMPVLLRKVIGGGEPVPAAADDHRVIAGLGRGIAPGGRPAAMAASARSAPA